MPCHANKSATSQFVQLFSSFYYASTSAWSPTRGRRLFTHAESLCGLGISTRVSASTWIMEVCDEQGGVDAHLIHASVTALALWWASSKLPRIVIDRSMGDFFSLGSRVLHRATNPAIQTCPLVPATYPPSEAMDGVSTNLGPVGDLTSKILAKLLYYRI
jgi:hypothetical protein